MASSRHAGHAGPCVSGRCASARHQGERTSTSRQTCCPLRFPRCAGSSGVSSGQGRPIPVASSLGRTGDADTSSAPDDHTGPAEPELINPGCSTRTTLHYADNLDNPANKAFLAAFKKRVGQEGDIYAVQGFDTAALLDIGLAATGGDWAARDTVITAMEEAKFDSPRGPLSFSRAHNPIQSIYLREVRNGRNEFVSIAQEAVKDPAHGCRLGV